MNNLIRKKVILCLLDSDSKSADEIAAEIDESLITVADQLTALVSEGICEEVSQDEISQYVVRKDIETFAQLVKGFLANSEEHKQETKQFITSNYYHTRIDYELVNYVLGRFYLDSVYQDTEKEELRKILLASPSGLIFALHDGDTESLRRSWDHWNQLKSPGATRDWFIQTLFSAFKTPLLEMLIADIKVPAYLSLYTKLEIRVATLSIQVGLATPHEKYVAAGRRQSSSFWKAEKELHPGQLVSLVDPMGSSDAGLAYLHLEDFEAALKAFDQALKGAQNSIQKATVLNNKGLAFLLFKQYQKAIGCFKEGLALDSDSEIPELRENKQIAEEYLARATDVDNLTQPTQIRFVQAFPVPFEETLFYEFKEIKGSNPARSITNDSDEYTVAFLNREGGRIFWGIRDSDRITTGVILNEQQRNDIREKVPNKLRVIQPPISPEHWQLEFHKVYDLQGEAVEDLWVIELVISPPQERDVFYTGSGKLFVKTDGGRHELQGQQITEFILRRLQNDTETE